MPIQTESSYNPARSSSGKRNFPLAAKVARELGIVPTWPNLQTIQLAIQSQSKRFQASAQEIAELFIRAGNEYTDPSPYSFIPAWKLRVISRANTIDRFWFEDGRWRYKQAYQNFVAEREQEQSLC